MDRAHVYYYWPRMEIYVGSRQGLERLLPSPLLSPPTPSRPLETNLMGNARPGKDFTKS